MKERYKGFVELITPHIIYACDRYIGEQTSHLEFLKEDGILNEDGYKESLKELKEFTNVVDNIFTGDYTKYDLMFQFFDEMMKKEYVDPDTYMFRQIKHFIDIIIKSPDFYELHKSFRHDINCINNYIVSVFDDDLGDPDPYNCVWKPTQLKNGMTASTMLRKKSMLMDDTDLHLSNKYDKLKKELNDVKEELFKKSLKRCLMISLDCDVCLIEKLVDKLDTLWV